jgi:hypothetical protein
MPTRRGFPRLGLSDSLRQRYQRSTSLGENPDERRPTSPRISAGRAILALDPGSSSLKFALFEKGASLDMTAKGGIDTLDAAPHFVAHDATGAKLAETRGRTCNFAATLEALLKFLDEHLGDARLGAKRNGSKSRPMPGASAL